MANPWKVGSKLLHPFNPELGVGVVLEVDGRFLVAYFPAADTELRLAAEASGLEPLVLAPGTRVRIAERDGTARVGHPVADGYELDNGEQVREADVWPLESGDSPIERLARRQVDSLGAFQNRIAGLRLQELREAGGLGSFLGGRIELFPHQLHTARRAVSDDPVRWLLADEVGLGKTIEACLILSALVRTGRAERALVVAPNTLTVQWLGELYRKFHQVFVLLDRERLESVKEVFGPEMNPFEVHPFGVISLDLLASDRRLIELASEIGIDLIVVDEAHRLAAHAHGKALEPLIRSAQHALLLTATPLQADREGFFQLLSLLHGEVFPSFQDFEAAVDAGDARMRCTSAVRRTDLGGLPPREPRAVALGPLPADPTDPREDPRAVWIRDQVRGWSRAKDKVLVFFHERAELERVGRFLETSTRTHMSVFHEKMSVAKRDIEVARFRDTNTPVLLCSEAGGEGRNFQFCDRMIHYDLPDDPVLLEQRIGRLDRIGRRAPVEILYFTCDGEEPDIAGLYERLDLFSRPSAGLDVALASVRGVVASARNGGAFDADSLVAAVEAARRRDIRDLPRSFYPDAYRVELADEILAAVPGDLEERTQEFCLGAIEDLGLLRVDKGGRAMNFVELGSHLKVEGLPGVPDDARYLGTFSRVEAIQRDELEFFASGHPLVEGLLLELEDGPRGRIACFESPAADAPGLLCVFRRERDTRFVIVDLEGKVRDEWLSDVLDSLSAAKAVDPGDLPSSEAFSDRVRELSDTARAQAGPDAQLAAVALITPYA